MIDTSDPAVDPVSAARKLLALARGRYPVIEAWLYGSHARGEGGSGSDVDLAIIVDASRDEARRIGGGLAEESFDLLMATGRFLSPFAISLNDWENPHVFANPALIRNIKRDGIPL
jgi:uncharacterized protein